MSNDIKYWPEFMSDISNPRFLPPKKDRANSANRMSNVVDVRGEAKESRKYGWRCPYCGVKLVYEMTLGNHIAQSQDCAKLHGKSNNAVRKH